MNEAPTSNRKRNNRIAIAVIALIAIGYIASEKGEGSDVSVKRETIDPQYPVYNNPWDGSVNQVRNYLKANLNDWESYESMEWSKVVPTDDGKSFLVRHKYRASNGFGANIIVHQFFEVSPDGQIVSVTDF